MSRHVVLTSQLFAKNAQYDTSYILLHQPCSLAIPGFRRVSPLLRVSIRLSDIPSSPLAQEGSDANILLEIRLRGRC